MSDLPITPLGSIASLVTDKVGIGKDPTKPYVGLEHIQAGGSKLVGAGKAEESISTNNVFHRGDVLFGKLRPRLRKCVRVGFDGYCSTDILVLRARTPAEPAFVGYVLQSDAVFTEAIRTEEGTKMPRCSWGDLQRALVFCPEPKDQRRIADILSTVDEAIEHTETLIAKTQQIKNGLMHDLFTRGVTPDGRLRPPRDQAPELYKQSPLGWIPREWSIRPCVEICVSVIDCKNRTPPESPEGHPVIRTPNVRDGEFVYSNVVYTNSESYAIWTERGQPRPGDVVITREAPVGEVCELPPGLNDPCLGQRMMLFRPDPNFVLGRYLIYALMSERVRHFLDKVSGGSTVGHVRVGEIRTLRVPYTELPEQERIASTLDEIRNGLSALEIQRHKLQEIKRGLMDDLFGLTILKPTRRLDSDTRLVNAKENTI